MRFNLGKLIRFAKVVRTALPSVTTVKHTLAAGAMLNSTMNHKYKDKVQTALEGAANAVVVAESIGVSVHAVVKSIGRDNEL